MVIMLGIVFIICYIAQRNVCSKNKGNRKKIIIPILWVFLSFGIIFIIKMQITIENMQTSNSLLGYFIILNLPMILFVIFIFTGKWLQKIRNENIL